MATDRIVLKCNEQTGTIYGLLDVDTFFVRFDNSDETVLVSRESVRPINPNEYLPSR